MKYRAYHNTNPHCLFIDRLQPNRVWIWDLDNGCQMRSEVFQWLEEQFGPCWQFWEFDTISSRIYFRHREHAMRFKLMWS